MIFERKVLMEKDDKGRVIKNAKKTENEAVRDND